MNNKGVESIKISNPKIVVQELIMGYMPNYWN